MGIVSYTAKFWERQMRRALLRPSILAPSLDELLAEYEKLSPRHWKKKRYYKERIALRALEEYRWKKFNENQDTV